MCFSLLSGRPVYLDQSELGVTMSFDQFFFALGVPWADSVLHDFSKVPRIPPE